jgi:hypothetical protein
LLSPLPRKTEPELTLEDAPDAMVTAPLAEVVDVEDKDVSALPKMVMVPPDWSGLSPATMATDPAEAPEPAEMATDAPVFAADPPIMVTLPAESATELPVERRIDPEAPMFASPVTMLTDPLFAFAVVFTLPILTGPLEDVSLDPPRMFKEPPSPALEEPPDSCISPPLAPLSSDLPPCTSTDPPIPIAEEPPSMMID